MSKFDIIDSHLHVYDLKVRANFPKQNPRSLGTYEFPNEEPLIRDMPQEYAKEIANKAGVKKVVFMMCYDDCPEESQWVYDNAQNVDLVIGIVAGLDLTKHDKLKKYINEFKTNFKHPKFCGIRHHVFYDESIILDELFQEGLAILEGKKLYFSEIRFQNRVIY